MTSFPHRTALAALLIFLGGCAHMTAPDPMTRKQLMQEAYFKDAAVGRRMERQAEGRHAEVYARMRADMESGKKITTPRVVKTVAPVYPIGRQMVDAQSGVWISFVVGLDGSTESVEWERDEIMASHPSFVEAAKDAVRKWKFQPATVDGRPVTYMMLVPVIFALK